MKTTVAILGSFKQYYPEILATHRLFINDGLQVIFPNQSAILEEGVDFVRLESDDPILTDIEVETEALRKIGQAKLIYIVAPGGYIGRTVCYEIGRLLGQGKTIYYSEHPKDLPIFVSNKNVLSPEDFSKRAHNNKLEAEDYVTPLSLNEYQKWVRRLITERGFDKETVSEVFTLLVEEVGELAKAIRKHNGQKVYTDSKLHDVEEEAADVLWLLLDISNRLNIDLAKAFAEKEIINSKRKWK